MLTPSCAVVAKAGYLACLFGASFASSAEAGYLFDDFSSGSDASWRHFDFPWMLDGTASTYSVEHGQYRLRGPASTDPLVTALSTVSTRQIGFSGVTEVSVDIIDWNDGVDPVISLYNGFSQTGNMTFEYAGLQFTPVDAASGLSHLTVEGEAVDTISFPTVDPSHVLRLSLTRDGVWPGGVLIGRIFDLTQDPNVPLATVTVPIPMTSQGSPGLGVSAQAGAGAPADVTFDNFRVLPAPGPAAMLGLVVSPLLGRRRRPCSLDRR